MKAKIIAIANQKGGVGKTTTSTALATGLARMGKKALLIDADPQCNATDTYQAIVKGQTTLYDVMKDRVNINEAIQKTAVGDIVAGDRLLEQADLIFTQQGREYILMEALENIQGYDYIIIDTPPRLGVLLTNALTAAQSLIITIIADRYSLQGLSELVGTINNCRKYANKNLTIEGLLVTMFNSKTNLSKDMISCIEPIAHQLNTKLFTTRIRATTAAKEAQARQKSIFDYAPYSNAGRDYTSFINELLEEQHG